MCPHKQAFVLSQGIIGELEGAPKVACPLHKKNFDLETGNQIGAGTGEGNDLKILTFPVKIDSDNNVLVELPSEEEVDAILGTHGLRVLKSDCVDLAGDAIDLAMKKAVKNVSAQTKAQESATQLNMKKSDNFFKNLFKKE